MDELFGTLVSASTAQNLCIVRCDDDRQQQAVYDVVVAAGKARCLPVKELERWESSAQVAASMDREAFEEKQKQLQQESGVAAAGGSVGAVQVNPPPPPPPPPPASPANAVAWGHLCKRKLWIICPFGSCQDDRLLRSAAVEIICSRTYECHRDFRVILLCTRRDFDRLPRVVRVLSGLRFGHHRYVVVPRGYAPELIDEPMEEYLSYEHCEVADDAPELADFQEQVFKSDPRVRVVKHDPRRYGRGDVFIRILRDPLKFNLTVHTLDMTKSSAGDVLCHCLSAILHTTRKLHHLVLSECSLTDGGIVELAAALRKNEHIWTLNISRNPTITDVGLVALGSIFAPGTRSRLEGLDMSFNNAVYDTKKQWSRGALCALWERLPAHPYLKYVSFAGCSLTSYHVIDLCDRWLGRYRRLTIEEWREENDPEADYLTIALRRKKQKAKRQQLQKAQQGGGAGTGAASAMLTAAEELELLEEEFLSDAERMAKQRLRDEEAERLRLEEANRLFEPSLVSLNLSDNTIGDAALGLLIEHLPIGLRRLHLQHTSIGAAGFRAVAYGLASLHLQLEELTLSQNNASLLTRRVEQPAEGADEPLPLAQDVSPSRGTPGRQEAGEDTTTSNTRGGDADSSAGDPLVFVPPALAETDWARFRCPLLCADDVRRAREGAPPLHDDGGSALDASSVAQLSAKKAAAAAEALLCPSEDGLVAVRPLFASLVSRAMINVLQADAVLKNHLATSGPATEAMPAFLQHHDDTMAVPGGAEDVEKEKEAQQPPPAAGSLPPSGGNDAVASGANTAFFSHANEVRALTMAPPQQAAIAALMDALDGNFTLHTLSLARANVGEEGVLLLANMIVEGRCGVRILDLSYTANIDESSAHKIKELLVGSAYNQERADADRQSQNLRADLGTDVGDEILSARTDITADSRTGGQGVPQQVTALTASSVAAMQREQQQQQKEQEAAPRSALRPQSPHRTASIVDSGDPHQAHPQRPATQQRVQTPLESSRREARIVTSARSSTPMSARENNSRPNTSGGASGSGGGGGGGGGDASGGSVNGGGGRSLGDDAVSILSGTSLGGTSSFLQDVEGNVIETDIGVLQSLAIAGNTVSIGERALLGLYRNSGLQVLDLRDMALTDAMLQPLADAADPSLRHAFNADLSIRRLMLGRNTIWRAGVKHLAAFVRHSKTLEELYLGDLWSAFTDDLGNASKLTLTKKSGLFFLEPLLEALSGGLYSCDVLKSHSMMSSVPSGNGGGGGGRGTIATTTTSAAAAAETDAASVSVATSSAANKAPVGRHRALLAVQAARDAAAASLAPPHHSGRHASTTTARGTIAGGPPPLSPSKVSKPSGGGAVVSLATPQQHQPPNLRLLDLSKNDVCPLVARELRRAVTNNDFLTCVLLRENPLLLSHTDPEAVDLRADLAGDTRFILE